MRALLAVALLLVAGCLSPAPVDEDIMDPIDSPAEADAGLLAYLATLATFPEMRIETDFGTIRAVLYSEWTPRTAEHVGGLAEDGFYDGLTFHRVVDDFVIQGGDPTGTGEGGSGPAGLSTNMVPLEIKEGLDFGSGSIGLARWTDDTGDSQYFITEKPQLHLSRPETSQAGAVFGAYSLFGQVFEGMDVVRQIAAVETDANDRPTTDVLMERVELLPPPADLDLLSLVPRVDDTGRLEIPTRIIAGHPFPVRWSEDGQGCSGQVTIRSPSGGDVEATLSQDAVDACTFEGTMTLPAGDHQVLGPGDVGIDAVHVVPWHDDYAAFTGATGNATA